MENKRNWGERNALGNTMDKSDWVTQLVVNWDNQFLLAEEVTNPSK